MMLRKMANATTSAEAMNTDDDDESRSAVAADETTGLLLRSLTTTRQRPPGPSAGGESAVVTIGPTAASPPPPLDPTGTSSSGDRIGRSSTMIGPQHLHLPTNVHTAEQLALLPDRFLSNDPSRPLLLLTATTVVGAATAATAATATATSNTNQRQRQRHRPPEQCHHKYSLRPLRYSVIFILIIEGLERLTYYGITNTQTAYLTGSYDHFWNANFTTVEASSYTSASIGIAYTSPFLGGIVADGWLGDYCAIVVGVSVLYLPGVALIAMTTIPGGLFGLLWTSFNHTALALGMLILMPLGTGFIKAIVNVFGAKQYHPLLQAGQIEAYYVSFYMVIIAGALTGGTVVPIVASQVGVRVAYLIPVFCLALGLCVFVAGRKRYVHRPPEKEALFGALSIIKRRIVGGFGGGAVGMTPSSSLKASNGGPQQQRQQQQPPTADVQVEGDVRRLLHVIPLSCLVLPFAVVFAHIPTVFILQGQAMRPMMWSVVDASLMAASLSLCGFTCCLLLTSFIYPHLAKHHGIKIATTHKYAIGSAFAFLSVVAAMVVDRSIKVTYHNDNNDTATDGSRGGGGSQIPVTWQIVQFAFMAMGEVFVFPTCYETAFTVAPKEQKSLASAMQLFFSIGLANFVSVAMYHAFGAWFPRAAVDLHGTGSSGVGRTGSYVDSDLHKYMAVLLGIAAAGILLNVAPPVKDWAERLRSEALHATATSSHHHHHHHHEHERHDAPPRSLLETVETAFDDDEVGQFDDDDDDDDDEDRNLTLLANQSTI